MTDDLIQRLADGDTGVLEELARAHPGSAAPLASMACQQFARASADDPASPALTEYAARLDAEVAVLLTEFRRYDAAEGHARQGLARAARSELSYARARAHHALGMLARFRGRSAEAVDHLNTAWRGFRELGDLQRVSEAKNSLGGIYLQHLRLAEAEAIFREVLATKRLRGDRRGEAITLGNLGRVAAVRGDHAEAIRFFEDNRELCRVIGDHHGLSTMANHIAVSRLALGDLDGALRAAQEGREAARQSPRVADRHFAQQLSARLLQALANARGAHPTADALRTDALAYIEEAERGFGEQRMPAECYRCRVDQARIRRDLGQFEAAAEILESARQWLDDRGDIDGFAEASLHLAEVHYALHQAPQAADLIAQARAALAQVEAPALARALACRAAVFEFAGPLARSAGIPETSFFEVAERALCEGRGIGAVLHERGLWDDERRTRAFAELGIARAPHDAAVSLPPAMRGRFDLRVLRRRRIAPMALGDDTLHVAMADPLDVIARDEVARVAGRSLVVSWLDELGIDALLETFGQRAQELVGDGDDGDTLLRRLLDYAERNDATDLHLDPARGGARVRMRIDGTLRPIAWLTPELATAVIARLEARCATSPESAARQEPTTAPPFAHGLQVTLVPTGTPAAAVIRLGQRGLPRSVDALGLDIVVVDALRASLRRRGGMVLVAGRARSGRTATLYATLEALDLGDPVVLMLESTRGYTVAGYRQVEFRREAGDRIATTLSAAVGTDTDLVAVDGPLTATAVGAAADLAASGSRVLAVCCAEDAAAALVGLAESAPSRTRLGSVLRGVVAQRLLRRLCVRCRKETTVDVTTLRALTGEGAPLASPGAYRAVGCEACAFTGYAGRVVVAEWLPFDAEVRAHLLGNARVDELRSIATRAGMTPLHVAAGRLALSGLTSIDEVLDAG